MRDGGAGAGGGERRGCGIRGKKKKKNRSQKKRFPVSTPPRLKLSVSAVSSGGNSCVGEYGSASDTARCFTELLLSIPPLIRCANTNVQAR